MSAMSSPPPPPIAVMDVLLSANAYGPGDIVAASIVLAVSGACLGCVCLWRRRALRVE